MKDLKFDEGRCGIPQKNSDLEGMKVWGQFDSDREALTKPTKFVKRGLVEVLAKER